MSALTPAEAGLLSRDPAVPALRLVLDSAALESAVARLPQRPIGEPAVRRFRYKPGNSVVAAVEVRDHSPGGLGQWFLLTGYASAAAAKLDKDQRFAQSTTSVVDRDRRWLLAPATADRSLRVDRVLRAEVADLQHLRCIAMNPRRRLVLVDGERVLKIYARGVRRLPRAAIRSLRVAGIPMPPPLPSAHHAVHASAWVPGRSASPGRDGAAVAGALARLHSTAAPVPPSWDLRRLAARVRQTAFSLRDVLPGTGPAAAELAERIARLLPSTDLGLVGTLHGDFSADQVLMTDAGPLLVDLDECTRGPVAWDAATWLAAQVARGSLRPVALPGIEPVPVLVAAALGLRADEAFRRRRPGWAQITMRMIDAGHAALDLGELRGQVPA